MTHLSEEFTFLRLDHTDVRCTGEAVLCYVQEHPGTWRDCVTLKHADSLLLVLSHQDFGYFLMRQAGAVGTMEISRQQDFDRTPVSIVMGDGTETVPRGCFVSALQMREAVHALSTNWRNGCSFAWFDQLRLLSGEIFTP